MSEPTLTDEFRRAADVEATTPIVAGPLPFADPVKEHDWVILDKAVCKSLYQQVVEAAADYEGNYSVDADDFIYKIIYVFKCNITGEVRIEERTSKA